MRRDSAAAVGKSRLLGGSPDKRVCSAGPQRPSLAAPRCPRGYPSLEESSLSPFRRTAAIALAMLSILAIAAPVAAKPGSGNSTGSAACENGGFRNWTRANGTNFKNEGDCTNYTAKGGVLVLIDRIAPTITNVASSTANGTYGTGAAILVQVVFSEAVIVTGSPLLTLETGTTDATASYQLGSGTSTLTFSYTVAAGDASTDLDYATEASLSTNGGTIRDGATPANTALLTLPAPGAIGSLGGNMAIVIDTTAPDLSLSPGSLLGPGTNPKEYDYRIGTVASATVTFTVTNNGNAASNQLGMTSPSSVGFVVSNNTCDGETLVPNDSCTFDLTWTAPAGCDTPDQFHGSLDIFGGLVAYIYLDARAFCPEVGPF